jgi:hypothetical protein
MAEQGVVGEFSKLVEQVEALKLKLSSLDSIVGGDELQMSTADAYARLGQPRARNSTGDIEQFSKQFFSEAEHLVKDFSTTLGDLFLRHAKLSKTLESISALVQGNTPLKSVKFGAKLQLPDDVISDFQADFDRVASDAELALSKIILKGRERELELIATSIKTLIDVTVPNRLFVLADEISSTVSPSIRASTVGSTLHSFTRVTVPRVKEQAIQAALASAAKEKSAKESAKKGDIPTIDASSISKTIADQVSKQIAAFFATQASPRPKQQRRSSLPSSPGQQSRRSSVSFDNAALQVSAAASPAQAPPAAPPSSPKNGRGGRRQTPQSLRRPQLSPPNTRSGKMQQPASAPPPSQPNVADNVISGPAGDGSKKKGRAHKE